MSRQKRKWDFPYIFRNMIYMEPERGIQTVSMFIPQDEIFERTQWARDIVQRGGLKGVRFRLSVENFMFFWLSVKMLQTFEVVRALADPTYPF